MKRVVRIARIESCQIGSVVICQNIHRLEKADSLFYTDVLVNDQIRLEGLLECGSMACTMSVDAEEVPVKAGLQLERAQSNEDIVLIDCGGVKVQPKCIYHLKLMSSHVWYLETLNPA